jgi:hypothetical protein
MRTGGGEPGEMEAYEELQRDLDRFVAQLERELDRAIDHVDRPKADERPLPATPEAIESVDEAQAGRVLENSPPLSKGVSEGRTVEILYGQLKKIRSLYREKGWSHSQIRQVTKQEFAVVWEWIDRISDESRRSEFLRVDQWDNGDGFIFRQIATLYQYAPHLSKKPGWGTVRDWRKAFHGNKKYGTPDGRRPRS